MKKIVQAVALAMLVLGVPAWALAFTLDIEAYIDGRDWLIIKGDTLQWHHLDYAAVGRHEGNNFPTKITTALMGTVDWIPEWAYPPPYEYPPPNEIRFEAYSSIFTGLNPRLPQADGSVRSLSRVSGRADLAIVQYPMAANGWELILEFNDNPYGSPGQYAAWTKARLEIVDVVPAPATILLMGSGLLILLSRRRR